MVQYFSKSKKTEKIQRLMSEALAILEAVGIPLHTKSERGLEKMAMAFLAVAGVTDTWGSVTESPVGLQTRQIITFINTHFEENISSGSYDDIRRKDLKLLVVADLILNSGDQKSAATNDPTRGYSLHPAFRELIALYGTEHWAKALENFTEKRPSLAQQLERRRAIDRIPVTLPGGKPLTLSFGHHNILQKDVIESFLPRFGHDCTVLYIGDTSNKMLHIENNILHELGVFELSHDELPDVIAYSAERNWLYLIEAVYSSGPMSEIRVHELKKLLQSCTAELIFVTAFLTRAHFRRWAMDIAWETEVWIAETPDHLIHLNGDRFLGPHT